LQEGLRRLRPYSRERFRRGKRYAEAAWRRARRGGQELWLKAGRNPRMGAVAAGALVVTLAGAYALSATGSGRSLCPSTTEGTKPPFLLLMDPVPPAAAGGRIEVRYDICGLPSGIPYKGKIRLQQKASGKKAAVKPLVVKFQDKVAGPADRREHRLELGSAKPGAYSLELTVVDDQGRVRKKVQKLLIEKP
jgi:hypothetical protein